MEPIETIEYKGLEIKVFSDDCPSDPREDMDLLGLSICFDNYGRSRDTQLGMNEYLEQCEMDKDLTEQVQTRDGSIYLVCSMEAVKKEYGYLNQHSIKTAKSVLEGESEMIRQWIDGEVYGYTVEKDGEHIDSCWGFYGFDHEASGLLDSAKPAIDSEIEESKDHESLMAL